MKMLLASLLYLACIGAFAADIFGKENAEPTLFGIRLGQTIPFGGAESFSRYTLCTNIRDRNSHNIEIPSQFECYMFSPTAVYQAPQFRYHRIVTDNTNHQVVAVFARFNSINPLVAPWGELLSEQFTNLLESTFNHYGQCETRLSEDMWDSGNIYRTTFFTPSGAGIVVSHHTQFSGEVCLYRVSAINHKKGGWALPERYPQPSLLKDGFHFKDMMQPHPALGLYEKYRSRRRSTIDCLEKRFAMSVAKLKSKRISKPAWGNIVLRKDAGRFDYVVMSGKDLAWEIQTYLRNHLVISCRLHLFDTTSSAYTYGMELLTDRILPSEVLCTIFSPAKGIPDICLVAPTLKYFRSSHPTVIIIRANCVLECVFYGSSGNFVADAAWILDFFEKKAGVVHVDGEGEYIRMGKAK